MPAPIKIAASDVHTFEIEALLARPRSVFSSRSRKRLQILRELIRGDLISSIVGRCEVTREGLRKIVREIRRDGLESVIAKIRVGVLKKTEIAETLPRRRGAPGATSLRETITANVLRFEPIITLASVIIGDDVQVALIGVRSTAPKNPGQKAVPIEKSETFKSVLKIARRPLTPHWTRGWIDEWIRRPFLFLPKDESFDDTASVRSSRFRHLAGRFRPEWGFVALVKGSEELLDKLLGGYRHVEVIRVPTGSMVSHLEAVLYTLRVTLNYRCALPTLEGLLNASMEWRGRIRSSTPFAWHSSERKVIAGARDRIVDFYIRAAGGYLLDLTSHAQTTIPVREQFNIATMPAASKAGLSKGNLGQEPLIDYIPFPGLAMAAGVGSRRKVEEINKFFAEHPNTHKFGYAVRLRPGQRRNFHLPTELLNAEKHAKATTYERAVISLPRQFLFSQQSASTDELARYAKSLTRRSSVISELTVMGDPAVAFFSKQLLKAIRSTFERNIYGDRVREIEGHDRWWRPVLHSPVAEMTIGGIRYREFGRVERLFEPLYFFSDDQLRGCGINDAIKDRLKDCVISEFATTASGLQQRSSNCLYPGYDREEEFRKMFVAFDADFMLREISDPAWKKLRLESEQWSAAVREIVQKEYFPEGYPDVEKILKTVRTEFRKSAWKSKELLPGWASQALEAFETSGRILRRALENAQSMSLDRQSPAAIVILTHKEILQGWKGFLGRVIRGKLVQESPKKVVSFESVPDSLPSAFSENVFSATEDGADDVCELLEAVCKNGANEAIAREFISLAEELPIDGWLEAIERMQGQGRSEKFVEGIQRALKLARSNGAKADQIVTEIQRELSALV